MNLKKLNIPCILALLLSIAIFSPIAMAGSPTDEIKTSIDKILATLRQTDLDNTNKREQIKTVIHERFDFKGMSRRALGKNWKKISEQDQNSFIDHFSKLLMNTYINRIEAYTDETIKYAREKIKKKSAIVYTLIVTKSVEIPINYKMKQHSDDWRVYDVVIEEVSLIRNYRSSYQSILKKEGIEALLHEMEKKIASLQDTKQDDKPS